MAWKSSFRQNYQNFLAHTVPPLAARISRVVVWEILPNGPFKFFEILASVTIHVRYDAVYSGTCLTVLRGILPLCCKNRSSKSKGVEVQIHSFVTWSLDGNEWSPINLIRFTPRKESYPLSRRLRGPQSLSWRFRAEEISLLLCNTIISWTTPCRHKPEGLVSCNSVSRVHGMFLKLITIRDGSLPSRWPG